MKAPYKKPLIITLICITTYSITLSVNAQNALTDSAAAAYADKRYNEAIALYRQAEREQGTSPLLYYNLGNTYYRLGSRGQAILNYERALKLDPSFDSARDNLQFVKEKNVIRDTGDETIFSAAASNVSRLFSSNEWATLALVLFLVTLALALCYAFASSVALRKWGFFGGILSLTLCAVAIACAVSHYHTATARNHAIVTVTQAAFSNSPREIADSTDVAFRLDEGYKVTVTDSVTMTTDSVQVKWLKVSTFDGKEGWSDDRQITII